MSNQNYKNHQLYLGVDGGGSKCRVIIYTDELGVLAEAVSGPANVLRGLNKAINNIVIATDEALSQLNLPADHKSELIAGIGLAGLNLQSCMDEMLQWHHPFKAAYFTSDLHIACIGAHEGQDGAVMIVGTGSSALVSASQNIRELGGHGFPVGDCGSGAWLGYKAIEHTLLVLDGIAEPSELSKQVADLYKIEHAIDLAQLVAHFLPVDFAKLAPMIMKLANEGDAVTMKIVSTGAHYLNEVCAKMLKGNTLPLALIGGLSPLMAELFSPDVKQRLVPALLPPERGAILFAQNNQNQS